MVRAPRPVSWIQIFLPLDQKGLVHALEPRRVSVLPSPGQRPGVVRKAGFAPCDGTGAVKRLHIPVGINGKRRFGPGRREQAAARAVSLRQKGGRRGKGRSAGHGVGLDIRPPGHDNRDANA